MYTYSIQVTGSKLNHGGNTKIPICAVLCKMAFDLAITVKDISELAVHQDYMVVDGLG